MERGELLDAYRRYLWRRRYAANTVRQRLMVARRWLEHIGDRWGSCGHLEIEEWIATLPMTPASQRNYMTGLSSFYRWALREQLLDRTPMLLVDRPRNEAPWLPRPARDSDVAMVLGDVDDQLAAMIGLMACGGLRCCEVSALTWDDVDLHAGTVFLTGKGKRQRLVELSDDVIRLLARLDTTSGRVFLSSWVRPMSPYAVSRAVNQAFRTRGYPTKAHQLRHRAATRALLEADGDLLVVRDFLGHSTVHTTQVYTKVTPGLVGRTSKRIRLPR